MQEYTFDEQMNAFHELQNPSKEWLSLPQYKNISLRAASKYPSDYSMRLYTINEQISALLRLNKKHS